MEISPVSPEFRLRPSLSDIRRDRVQAGLLHVSPEFRLRPSLSVRPAGGHAYAAAGVAGVQTPAFVERGRAVSEAREAAKVSPEFRLRPSLSVLALLLCLEACHCVAGVQTPAFVERGASRLLHPTREPCRRSSDSGLR